MVGRVTYQFMLTLKRAVLVISLGIEKNIFIQRSRFVEKGRL